MRKLISASKRKWVLGGILGFAAVALTTTGFATWIVGVNAITQNGNVNVSVDTVKNNGVELTLKLGSDASIELKEANTSEGPVVTVEGNDTAPNPLQISVSEFTLEVGKQFLDENTITGVEFFLKETTDKETEDIQDNAKNKVTDNKLGNKRSGTSWHYLNAPANVEFTNRDIIGEDVDGEQTSYTYSISKTTLDFTWGDFFDGDSPATFYNTKFASGATKDEVDNIVAELEAMRVLDNGTLVLTAKLAYTAKIVGA